VDYRGVVSEVSDVPVRLAEVIAGLEGQHRANQDEMAVAVADTIEQGGVLLVQAGTGTGKSLGYLVPAILALGDATERVVISTATLALQRQLVTGDLPSVLELDAAGLTTAVLKGRANYLCKARLAAGADGQDAMELDGAVGRLEKEADRLRSWAEQTQTGDRDDFDDDIDPRVWRAMSATGRECVGASKCSYALECFAENAKEAAARADIVVTNHAVLALDGLDSTALLPEHDVLIVDEAHDFPARATSASAVDLTIAACERATREARSLIDGSTHGDLVAATADLEKAFIDYGSERVTFQALPQSLVEPLAALRDCCHVAVSEVNRSDAEAARRHRVAAGLQEIHDVIGDLLSQGPDDVLWFEGRGAPGLHLAPLSVTEVTKTVIGEPKAVILTSATLALGGSFESFRHDLGLAGAGIESSELDVGSPFDYGAQGILYVATDLPRPGRDAMNQATLERALELVEASGGGALILLSSWRAVEEYGEYFRAKLSPEFSLLLQRRGEPVTRLVKEMSLSSSGVLIGTLSLFQGVDLPGDLCRLVIIDRIPFPRPDEPVLAARSSRVEEAGGSGFTAISVPRAALLLAQGAGRLIRTPSDRGVVAVLDPRLVRSSYGSYLRRSLPDFWNTQDRTVVMAALERLREASRRGRGMTDLRPSGSDAPQD